MPRYGDEEYSVSRPTPYSGVRIVHLSDLHFGTVLPHLVDPLLRRINELHPRVLVVSGDLTQRGRESQFAAAASFLNRIPVSKVVVPGNHDIPLWNLIRRFVTPLLGYRRHLGDDLEPTYEDDELIVVGVNTARSLAWKGGRISDTQIERLGSCLGEVPSEVFKVVAMHHPLIPVSPSESGHMRGRPGKAWDMLERTRTDLILSGHGHQRHAGRTSRGPEKAGHSILVIQAGTALSDRRRGMPNSFNLVEMERNAVIVTPYEWLDDQSEFAAVPSVRFEKRGVWERAPAIPTNELAGRCR